MYHQARKLAGYSLVVVAGFVVSRVFGLVRNVVVAQQFGTGREYEAFIAVVDRDVLSAQAAVRLVLAQPSIGSELVDNLNASSHLRAVLTDLFLLDEALKRQVP